MIYPSIKVYIKYDKKNIKVNLKRLDPYKHSQELQEVFSNLVSEDANIYFSMSFSSSLIIETSIKDPHIVSSQGNFLQYLEELNLATQKFLGTEKTQIDYPRELIAVNIAGVPDILVNVDHIVISSPEGNISLHNIHKKISCRSLKLEGHEITSNVLGILLIKNLKLLLSSANAPSPEWEKIIKKHFDADKDVLECQEELLENGFKEYAKL